MYLDYFNPRLREGGDPPGKSMTYSSFMISIHASAKEATASSSAKAIEVLTFQSTPPRRRRHEAEVSFDEYADFNPRLREGDDGLNLTTKRLIFDFNPRLREGDDQMQWAARATKNDFNPRLREGDDSQTEFNALNSEISIHASAKETTRNTLP